MTYNQNTSLRQSLPWVTRDGANPSEGKSQGDSSERNEIDLQSLVGRIGNVPFFKSLPPAALKDIVYAGQVRNFPASTTLFREGDEAAGMHVLFRGQIHLCKVGLQGIETIVHIVNPVIMFNETTVIDGLANPVTAVACIDSTTWQVSPEEYQRLMERYPEVGLGLLRIMAARNRVLLARYEDLMSRPVLARTAKLLYSLSQGGRQSINRHDHSNQRIAAMAGTVPEAVSRSIKVLKENEVIECSRSLITILSIEQLTCFAQLDPSVLKYGPSN